jgi:release factor glutamine methyltransferase
VADRVDFICSDLLEATPVTEQFDFIVSNPPYVSSGEYLQLAEEIRRYEPREALVAGPRGTEIIERLLPQAATRLSGDGWLLLEISPMIEAALQQIVEEAPEWETMEVVKDLAGLPRVARLRRRAGADP